MSPMTAAVELDLVLGFTLSNNNDVIGDVHHSIYAAENTVKTTLKFLGVELMPNGRCGVHVSIDNSCVNLIVWNASLMSNPSSDEFIECLPDDR